MEVLAFYNRCEDQYCGVQTNLGGGSLGYVLPGEPARLRVRWDHPNHRFVFEMNRRPTLVFPYTVSDTTPTQSSAKWIGLTRVLPACTSAPRPTTMMEVYFSNVYVNPR
jgi:hypothetical protein